ncbi:hypothetical protein MLD38_023793 [Melastoma candidum]|uniref:Uncharacterized protein n=1 Tax=Melastoma candidum TaxID=119954 RepID=A0ACB9NWZ2_9MYRT|nr:hypothetical protein MLD38_023793 [Melastoma candidum]
MDVSLDSLPLLLRFNNHLFSVILTVLIFFAVKACFHKRSSSRFSNMKLPPGPKPLPVLGNMHLLRGGMLHVVLRDLAKTYGPICHLKLGQISLVSVSSSEVAKEILKTQELMFAQRDKLPILEMTSFDHSSPAFAPYGEYWRTIKKIYMTELFSPGRLRNFRSLREMEIKGLVESVYSTAGLPFSLSEMIVASANSIISKASFGSQCKRAENYLSAVTEQFRLAGQFSLPMVFPSLQFLYHLDGTKSKMSRFNAIYDDILGSIIADSRNRAKSLDHSSSYKENLADVLLRLQESPETRISLTDNTIKDVILDIINGGTDTSPTAVEWALSEMLKNPDVMKRAQTELRDALKGKPVLEESDLEKIKYLKLIIKETFRLHPPATMFGRVMREDCSIHRYDIPKDSLVVINAWSMGRDPNYWENPEKFYPERFLGSSIDLAGKHFEFLPFGMGRRMCPGMGFALANMELTLANLMYYFDWQLANGLPPAELDMAELSGQVTKRLNPLLVVATPHQPTA